LLKKRDVKEKEKEVKELVFRPKRVKGRKKISRK
jgi:hypothetical protein